MTAFLPILPLSERGRRHYGAVTSLSRVHARGCDVTLSYRSNSRHPALQRHFCALSLSLDPKRFPRRQRGRGRRRDGRRTNCSTHTWNRSSGGCYLLRRELQRGPREVLRGHGR